MCKRGDRDGSLASRHRLISSIIARIRSAGPSSRGTVLLEACEGDEELQREVEELLAYGEAAERDLATEAVRLHLAEGAADVLAGDLGDELPAVIDRYRILRLLGEGGMCRVFEAEQEHPRRLVALKVLRPGMCTPALRKRFEQEAAILANLKHSGIAQIYDVGMSGSHAFFAMELVVGRTLLDYADQHALPVRRRLDLFARICDVVDHAHTKGVIHRDLKPANILVEESGQPKVLDFGVARVLNTDLVATTLLTEAGAILGTLPYMSPEQFAGDPAIVDARCDVFALGVILWQLLTGSLPYAKQPTSLSDALQAIKDEEPVRLKTADPSLRGDISTMAGKALEKHRGQRYQSASALSDDVRRYLANMPIKARPPTATYRLSRFARRNKALVGGVAAVFVLLLTASLVVAMLAVRANRERLRAQENAARALESERTALRQAYRAGLGSALTAYESHDLPAARRRLEEAPKAQRGWEWRHLNERLNRASVLTSLPERYGHGLRFSADGQSVMAVHHNGTSQSAVFRVLDAETGNVSGEFHLDGRPLLLPPEGLSLALPFLAPAQGQETVEVCQPETRRPYATVRRCGVGGLSSSLEHDNHLVCHTWLEPSGLKIGLFSPMTGLETPFVGMPSPAVPVWDDAGARAFGTGEDPARALIFDARTGAISPLPRQRARLSAVDLSSEGTHAVIATEAGDLQLWDIAAGREVAAVAGSGIRVNAVAACDRAELLAAVGADRELTIRHYDLGEESAVLDFEADKLVDLAFSPGGERLAGLGSDGSVLIWNLPVRGSPLILRGHAGHVTAIDFDSHSGRFVSVDSVGRLCWWNARTGGRIACMDTAAPGPSHDPSSRRDRWFSLKVSSGSAEPLIAVSEDNHIRLLEASTGESVSLLRSAGGPATDLDFHPSGNALASAHGADAPARVRDPRGGNVILKLPGPALALSYSPDGRRLAMIGPHREVLIVDAETGAEQLRIASPAAARELDRGASLAPDAPCGIAWHPGGERIAVSTEMRRIGIWDSLDGHQVAVAELTGTGMRHALAFSRDGTRLFSGCSDGRLRVFETETYGELAALPGHGAAVGALAMGPHGRLIATGCEDGMVGLWTDGGAESDRAPAFDGAARGAPSGDPSPDGLLRSAIDARFARPPLEISLEIADKGMHLLECVQQAQLTSSDPAVDGKFGKALHLSGDRLFVSDQAGAGSVHVFERSGSTWKQTARLVPDDGVPGMRFGCSLDADCCRLLVGSGEGGALQESMGAYVYRLRNGQWVQEAKISGPGNEVSPAFGRWVALAGDTAIVSAPWAIAGGSQAGAVDVFSLKGSNWRKEERLIAGDGAEGDHFGFLFSLDGDRLLISCHGDDDNGFESGSAYVFERDETGWIETAKIKPNDGSASDFFSLPVLLRGDRAFIGSAWDCDNGEYSGSVYVFERDDSGWKRTQKVIASDGVRHDQFGRYLDVDEDLMAVGAPGHRPNNRKNGAAYVFVNLSGEWIESAKLTPVDSYENTLFGSSVCVDGSTVVIGATRQNGDKPRAGAVYVFHCSRLGPAAHTETPPAHASPSPAYRVRPASRHVKVALLSPRDYDLWSAVDRHSLSFGLRGDERSLTDCLGQGEDINGDGFDDLVCRFDRLVAGLHCGDRNATLRGQLYDGSKVEGSLRLAIEPCP